MPWASAQTRISAALGASGMSPLGGSPVRPTDYCCQGHGGARMAWHSVVTVFVEPDQAAAERVVGKLQALAEIHGC
jgi:hypothetical protein